MVDVHLLYMLTQVSSHWPCLVQLNQNLQRYLGWFEHSLGYSL